ncbi:MAG: MMPL family transporter, partial [Theionarchaea archaeon]|nr:MMPL family transporter [Theionarchaea archaeon]
VIGISVVWVLGIMGYSGITFSNIFVAIMPLIYGVSVAYSVHLLTRYYEERAKGSISSRSAVIGIKTVGMAILLTVITTSFGFGSFTISDLPPLQEFGIVLVLGIIFSFLLVITLMPSLLVLRDEGTPAGEKRQSRTNKLLDRISLVALHHKKYVLLLTGITVAACVAVAPTIPTSIDYDELLPQESITISTEQEVAELFGGGSESVIIMVEGDILSEYESLLMIEERIRALPLTNKDGTPVVTGVVSFADMLYRVQGNLQAACADQQAAAILSQTLVLDDSHANYLTKGLILVFVDAESDAEARNLTREIRGIIENHPTLSLKLGGAPVLMADILDGMQSTQIKTTALALVLSLIVVILLFRSVPLGIMTVLPVILTIAWEFGVLKVTGWNLDIFTIMVSALIIGIGIDFSIHVVHRFREEFEKTMVAETAVENTVLNVGKALISTTATTGGAFLVLALSSMPIITRFGLLVAIVIGLSFLSALLVLPSILVYYFERKK